ncbi:MAG: HEAT repeat domain-containing protein [Pseudomonadota bacterium]
MSGRVKLAFGVLALIVAVGGGALYVIREKAGEDTKRLTTLEETEQTPEVIEKTLSVGGAGFDEANKALKASGKLSEGKQIELLGRQMENDNATIRLSAYQELFRLHREGSAAAGTLLEACAAAEQDRENLLAIQGHLAERVLDAAGDDPGARLAVLNAMASDARPGYRMAAVKPLAALADASSKALLEALAKDPDEDVSMTAAMFLEGDDE